MTFGRCTLISTVFSDGNFIWMMIQDIVESKEFCRFLQILKYVLKQSKIELMANIPITFDNTPMHTSLVLKKLNKVIRLWSILSSSMLP